MSPQRTCCSSVTHSRIRRPTREHSTRSATLREAGTAHTTRSHRVVRSLVRPLVLAAMEWVVTLQLSMRLASPKQTLASAL